MALVIIGHPSFQDSLANKTILEQLKKSVLSLEVRNLAELYPDYRIDVLAEQQALIRHQTIVFQYPMYWYSMPAILKHWFDVVFTYQFAYGSLGDKLKNKNFLPSFTVGAPEEGYRTLGDHHFRVLEFCKHLEQTAYYAQMNYIDPVYIHGTSVAAGYDHQVIHERAKAHGEKLIEKIGSLP
jgi:putative NADPH-quinone reductase